METIPRERFSLPRFFLKPKRDPRRFRPIAAIVGDVFLAYLGPIVRHHAGKELDLNAKLSLPRAALEQEDPWNIWEPFGEGGPGLRIRTGDDIEKAADAIDILFADKMEGRKLLGFIKASKKKNRDRENLLLFSSERYARWFTVFFGEWMADTLAPIIGPGRRLADSEIIGLTAYLLRKNNVGVAGKERILPADIARQEAAVRRAFIRWKKSVT